MKLTSLTTDGVGSNTFRYVRRAVLQSGCLRLRLWIDMPSLATIVLHDPFQQLDDYSISSEFVRVE